MKVIQMAMAKGLDFLTLSSHTSHALQPLDATCFKPFKLAFRAYCDKWSLANTGQIPLKEDLAQWLSQALNQALSIPNITKAFQCTRIFPFDPTAMDLKMSSSIVYSNVIEEGQ